MPLEKISIRTYQANDEDMVIKLWNDVFPNDPPHNRPDLLIQSKLREQAELFFVALDGERVIGAVMAGFDGTRGWVHHLAVNPDMRRRGVGKALVDVAVAGLKARGCPKVNLQVRATNTPVIAFYESLGFKTEDVLSMGMRL